MPLFKNRKILYKHILYKMHRIDITLYRIYMDKFMLNKQTIIGINRRSSLEKILCIVTQILYLFYILGIPVYASSAEHSSALSLKLELFQLTNSCRRNNNLEGLIELESMDKAAQILADDMCYLEMLSHYGYRREYRTLSDRLRMNDFIGENIGENIARQQEINDNSYSSTKEIFDVWKNSTEHRKNILGDFVYTGIGTCKDRNGYRYWVQVFGKEYNNKDLMKFKMNGKGKIKEKCDEDGKNGCNSNKDNSNDMKEDNNKDNNGDNKKNKKDKNRDNNENSKKDNNENNKKNNIPKIEFIINSKDGKITPPENLPDILNNIYDYFKEKENNDGKDKDKENQDKDNKNKSNKDIKYDKDRNNNSIEDIQTITIAIPSNDKEPIKIDTTKDNKGKPDIFQQKKDKAPISIVTITQTTSPVDTNKEKDKDKKISSIIPKDNISKNKDSDMTDKLTDSLRELKELISSLKSDKNIDIFNKIKDNLNNNIDDKDNRNRDNDPYKDRGNNRDIRNENNNPMNNRNNDINPYKDRNNDTNIRNGNNNPMNNRNNDTDNRRDNNPMNNRNNDTYPYKDRNNNPMNNGNNRNNENVFKTPISIINEYPGEIKVVPIEDKEKKENGKNIKLCKYLEEEYKNSLPLSILEFYTKYCNTYRNKRTGNNYTNGNRNINNNNIHNNKLDFNIIKPNQWNTKNNPLFHYMEFSNDPCKGKDNIEIGLPLYYGVHQ